MRKLLFLFILFNAAIACKAQQNISFTINTQPCNNNGIVTATIPAGLTYPIFATWSDNNGVLLQHNISALTDVLTNWDGHPIHFYAVGFNNQTAYGTISAPPFTLSHVVTPANCPIPGSVSVAVAGGMAPYMYQWLNKATQTVVSTSNPASLPDGNYRLTVTDANNCVYFQDSLHVWSTPPFSFIVTNSPANCTNGTATVSNVTATPPFSYLWSNSATTPTITGLSKGSYTVTVTDANNCSVQKGTFVNQAINIGTNITTTPATCTQNNGAIISFGSGGVPPYTYLWNNSATTQSLSNLAPGTYKVKVTDANGCFGNGTGYINASTPITVTQTNTPSSCISPTGSATISISGGTPPYSVTWNTFPVQSGVTASNLAPGTYSFHVVDAVGCVRNGSVVINPVNMIHGMFSSTKASCTAANGALSFSPAGGTSPYTYLWSNNSTSQNNTGLAAGYYTVTVTDNVGCTATSGYFVLSSSPVSVGLSTTQASCLFTSDGSITATPSGGLPPYTYTWSNSATTNVNSNIGTGWYYLTVTDANGCKASAHTFVPYNQSNNSCYCTISGTVYNDANSNCIKDAGEAGIPNIQIHCSGKGYAYTNASGNYSFVVPTGSYTISQTILGMYPLTACQSNNIVVNAVASSGCVQSANFANNVNPIHDIHVSTWKNNCPVPGFSHSMTTIISNNGTVAESGIVAGKQSDVQINAPTFIPSTLYNSGGAGYYSFSGGALTLNPGNSQAVSLTYSIPTNIPINTGLVFKDTVAYVGPVSNWVNDYSPWNNLKHYTSQVVSSFDPNFKEVYPAGAGPTGLITPADSVLEYMVHFQNLGNYQATNVVVVDTLDGDLDWTTLRPLYHTHPWSVTISEGGVATFTFKNINLPAKMFDEEGSNGMFTFTIKTKSNMPLGTQWTNSAAIYFDFNAAVITNTTINTLHNPQSVENISANGGSLSVYPNPANNTLYARIKAATANTKAEIKVVDVSGKTLMSKNVTLDAGIQTVQLDIETLAPGMYFINVAGNGRNESQKFVIIK